MESFGLEGTLKDDLVPVLSLTYQYVTMCSDVILEYKNLFWNEGPDTCLPSQWNLNH